MLLKSQKIPRQLRTRAFHEFDELRLPSALPNTEPRAKLTQRPGDLCARTAGSKQASTPEGPQTHLSSDHSVPEIPRPGDGTQNKREGPIKHAQRAFISLVCESGNNVKAQQEDTCKVAVPRRHLNPGKPKHGAAGVPEGQRDSHATLLKKATSREVCYIRRDTVLCRT